MSLAAVVLCAAGATAQAAPQAASQSASEDVPEAVAGRVRVLAERSETVRRSLAGGRTVFVGVDLVRTKTNGDGEREPPPLYRVRHYRYADDVTVTSLVDLAGGRVAEQVETPHAPVPITVAELDEARALALADAGVGPGCANMVRGSPSSR